MVRYQVHKKTQKNFTDRRSFNPSKNVKLHDMQST